VVTNITGETLEREERDAAVEAVPDVVSGFAATVQRSVLDQAASAPTASIDFEAQRHLQLGIQGFESNEFSVAEQELLAAANRVPSSAKPIIGSRSSSGGAINPSWRSAQLDRALACTLRPVHASSSTVCDR
jgi:hypothetical protein